MAIAIARARYLSGTFGSNVIRSAAYNAHKAIETRETGKLLYFRHRDVPEHHEVLLPEEANAGFANCAVL